MYIGPFSVYVRKSVEEAGDYTLLHVLDCDAVYGYVAFMRTEEVLWSEEGSNGWFPYSWEVAVVSSVPALRWVNNRRKFSGARRVVEDYAELPVFVSAGSVLFSVAGAQR